MTMKQIFLQLRNFPKRLLLLFCMGPFFLSSYAQRDSLLIVQITDPQFGFFAQNANF